MPMNKLFAIIFTLPVLLLCACSDEEDVLPAQRDKIVTYLKSTHQPPLVPQEQVEPGTEVDYYTTRGNTVYRYIRDVYAPDRDNQPEVTRQSLVSVTYSIYVFTFATISTDRLPEFSNDPTFRAGYMHAGLDVSEWSFNPEVFDMGRGNILKGLRLALLGCRQGDRVEAWMTYNMAYGDGYFSIIPKESPVYISFTVESVE